MSAPLTVRLSVELTHLVAIQVDVILPAVCDLQRRARRPRRAVMELGLDRLTPAQASIAGISGLPA
jgi:hypothetical protein